MWWGPKQYSYNKEPVICYIIKPYSIYLQGFTRPGPPSRIGRAYSWEPGAAGWMTKEGSWWTWMASSSGCRSQDVEYLDSLTIACMHGYIMHACMCKGSIRKYICNHACTDNLLILPHQTCMDLKYSMHAYRTNCCTYMSQAAQKTVIEATMQQRYTYSKGKS